MTLPPSYFIPPLASYSPAFSLLTSDLQHLTSAFSSTSALFIDHGPTQALSHQSFAHSFSLQRGVGVPNGPTFKYGFCIPHASSGPPKLKSSSDVSVSLLESTLAQLYQNKRLYLPLESTLTKNRGRGHLDLATFQPSNVQTVVIPPSYCVRYRTVPQWATYDASTRKQSRFFRCLKRESGQRVRQALNAGPGKRSILDGDVGRPESTL